MRIFLSLVLLSFSLITWSQVADSAKSIAENKNQKALIIINGIEQPKRGIQNIDTSLVKANMIESINILNGKSAIDKYGDRGKDGVVEIIMKKREEKVVIKELTLEEKQEDENQVFTKIEVEAAFKGGEKEWKNFLMKNLNANVPVERGARPGTYTVVLQFIVDRDGVISDLTALTNHGYGMEEECLRLLKLTKSLWVPGIQNGRHVKAYRKLPISFVIAAD